MIRRALPAIAAALLIAAPAFAQSTPAPTPAPVVLPAQPAAPAKTAPAAAKPAGHDGCPYKRSYTS